MKKKPSCQNLRNDPDKLSKQGLAYVVQQKGAVGLIALVFRKFGKQADPLEYGEMPGSIQQNRAYNNRAWTDCSHMADTSSKGMHTYKAQQFGTPSQ